jgi:AraC family transcriptional regulator
MEPDRPGIGRRARVLGFSADMYAPDTRHHPHQHDELHFSLVLKGVVAETVGGTTEVATALSVVGKDAGVVHANDFGRGGATLARLTLDRGTIGDLIDDPSRSPGWRWTHDPRVAGPFLRLVRRANGQRVDYGPSDPDVVDLLAAFTARPATATRGTAPAWLVQVMREIREGWQPCLTVPSVARRAGVHPVYLARCVRRWFGTGLGEELRRQRLRAAAAHIAATRLTISDVAHAGGYSDEPHLNREFSAVTGISPGRFRAMVHRQTHRLTGAPNALVGDRQHTSRLWLGAESRE